MIEMYAYYIELSAPIWIALIGFLALAKVIKSV